MNMIRFVVIVPDQGSAYYRESDGGLIQLPIDGGVVLAPQPGNHEAGGETEVDWLRGFESPEDEETVRVVERALEAIPDDLSPTIAPYRFNLTLQLGVGEMESADQVAGALRRAADTIEDLDELDGPIFTASGGFNVGHYSGCLPGQGKLCANEAG